MIFTADTSAWDRAFAAAKKDLATFSKDASKEGEVKLGADTKSLDKDLSTAKRSLASYNRDADKSAGTSSKLSSAFSKLGDDSSSASGGMSELAGSIKNFRTVSAAVAGIPALIAGVGGVAGAATAAAGAVGQLSLALGQGLAGAAAIGGTALVGAQVGLKAYSAVLTRVVEDSRAAYEATHENAIKQLELQRNTILNTQASKDFNNQINETIINFTKLEAAVGKKVFPEFTRELDYWNEYLDEFQPKIVQTADSLGAMVAGFSEFVRTAQDGKLVRDIFDFINQSALAAGRTLFSLGQSGLLIFQHLIGPATHLQNQIATLAEETNEWVESSEGMKTIGSIVDTLQRRFYQLVNTVRDFGLGIVGVFQALDATGGPDRLMKGLEDLASGFRRVMSSSGGGRQAIIDFMNAAQPTLNQLWGLTKEVVIQFGILANNVVKAGQSGGKLGTLAEAIKGLKESVAPLRRLFQETFIALGPALADLLPEVARLGETFLGSTGPLITFLEGGRRLLHTFNELPDNVKTTVANLVAFKAIVSGFGFGGAIASVGNFAANMFLVNSAAAKLNGAKGLAPVAAGLKGIGLALVGGLGIAALAGAFYLAYKNSDRFREAVNGLVEDLKGWGKGVFDDAKKAVRDIFDFDKKSQAQASDYGVKGAHQLATKYTEQLRKEAANQRGEGTAGYEFGRKSAQAAQAGWRSIFTPESGNKAIPDKWWKNAFEPPKLVNPKAPARQFILGFADELGSERSQSRVEKAWAKGLHNPSMAAMKALGKGLNNAWQNITGNADSQMGKTGKAIITNLEDAKKKGGQSQRELESNTKGIWQRILEASGVWGKIASAIINASQKSKAQAGDAQRDLESNTKSIWQRILEATPVWGKIASFIIKKSWDTERGSTNAWQSLEGFVKGVLERLGIDTGGSSGSTPAEKKQGQSGLGPGSPAGSGPDFQARGGIIHQSAVGGFADGGTPHAVYGEVGKREYYIVPERKDNVRYLQGAASEMGFGLVKMARGGILDAWKKMGVPMHALGATLPVSALSASQQQAANAVHQKFPSTTQNTYVGHPGGQANSFDNWGPGGRGDPIGSVGNAVKSFLIGNFSPYDWLIWNGTYTTPSGSKPYWDPADMHYDHVHFTRGASGFSGGPAMVKNWKQTLFEQLWRPIQGLSDRVFGAMKAQDFWAQQAAGGLGSQTVTAIHDWIDAKIPDMVGAPSGTGRAVGGHDAKGGDAAANRTMGKKMLAASGIGGSWAALNSLWTKESGWDRFAKNPSSGAYGIPQAYPESKLPAAGQSSGGSYAGPQIDWGLGYIGNRYGSTDKAWAHSQELGWYENGGFVKGRRGKPVPAILHGGEYVVPESVARYAAGGLTFNGPLANQAIGVARSFWGPSGASFGYGPGFSVRFHEGIGGARTGNGIIGIDPKFAGSDIFDELLGHEIGHAGGLPHAGGPNALMTNPVFNGDRPLASELSAFARSVGVSGGPTGGGGGYSGGGSGAGLRQGGWGGGSVNRNSVHSTGGSTSSVSSQQGSSSASSGTQMLRNSHRQASANEDAAKTLRRVERILASVGVEIREGVNHNMERGLNTGRSMDRSELRRDALKLAGGPLIARAR